MAGEVMSYEEKCKVLGIERPASLRGKFPDAPNGALQGKVQGIHNLPMGERKSAGEPPEDLTHLNPPSGRKRQQYIKKAWASMSRQERKERNGRVERAKPAPKHFWATQSKT